MKKIFHIITLFLLFLPKFIEASESKTISVIVGANSPIQEITKEKIRELFLGETRYVNDQVVKLGERNKESSIHEEFHRKLTGLKAEEFSVHWAKKIFSGKAAPPERINGNDEDAKKWVVNHPNGISYIYKSSLEDSVRVILQL